MRRVLIHLSWTTAARYAAEAAFAVRGVVLAAFLGPELFGVWAGMRLLLLAKDYAGLGALDGLVQLAPFEEARGDHATARRLAASSAGLVLAIGGAGALAVAAAVLLSDAGEAARGHWLAFAALVFAVFWYELHQGLLAAARRFRLRATAELCHAVLSTAGGLWAARELGLEGFLWTVAASHAIASLWGFGRDVWPGLSFDPATARRLLVAGLPIAAAYGLLAVLWHVDRLLLWIGAGSEAMGVYALQSQIVGALLLLPAVFEIVLLPHLRRLAAGDFSEQRMSRLLAPSVLALTGATAPVLGVVAVTLGLPIRWWLPQYAAAIRPGEILSVSVFFVVAATIPATFLVAAGRLRPLLGARAIAIALTAALVALPAARADLGLVAWGAAAGLLGHAVLVFAAAHRSFGHAWVRRAAPGLAVTFAGLALGVYSAFALLPPGAESWPLDLWRAGGRALVVLVPTAPAAAWSIRGLRRAFAEEQGGVTAAPRWGAA